MRTSSNVAPRSSSSSSKFLSPWHMVSPYLFLSFLFSRVGEISEIGYTINHFSWLTRRSHLCYSNYKVYKTATITRPHLAAAAHKAPTPRRFASPSHTGPLRGHRRSAESRAAAWWKQPSEWWKQPARARARRGGSAARRGAHLLSAQACHACPALQPAAGALPSAAGPALPPRADDLPPCLLTAPWQETRCA